MLLDLLANDNYVRFNKKLAHTIGLEEAIYLDQVINIIGKAIKKDKVLDDDFINLDRNYIYAQTTFTIEQQLKIEVRLQRLKVLTKDFDNDNLIKIDLEKLSAIAVSDDEELIESIQRKVSIGEVRLDSNTKANNQVSSLKKYIHTGNDELDNKVVGWLDFCIKEKKTYINVPILQSFIKDVLSYSNNNFNIALDVVEIATKFGYRDCKWAIKRYEDDKRTNSRTTIKEVASRETLSKKSF